MNTGGVVTGPRYHHLTSGTPEEPWAVYMVRAVKREHEAGGTYLNSSQGVTT